MFNSLVQSQKFDPEGKYIRMWCPELENVPLDYIHDPWNMPAALQKKVKVQIGGKPADASIASYPTPITCTKYTSAEAAKKIKRKSEKAAPKTSPIAAFLAKGKK